MSVNIPDHFITSYTTNVAHLLQVKGGKMRPLVTEAGYTGEAAVPVDQYGAVEMQEVVGRFAPMGRVDAAVDRRWVYPIDYDLPQMVDTFDKLRLMTDPQSSLAQAAVMATQRKMDSVIFDAFFGAAKTGKTGSGTETFDTTNHRVDAAVGASTDTGLNADKIIRAKRIMQDNNVDFEMDGRPCIAISPQQEEDLLHQAQVVNNDYFNVGGRPVLVDGKVTQWCGCDIVVSNLVPSNSSYRLVPMWVKNGMHLGVWSDVKARVDVRADIQGTPYQLYSTMTVGATRLEAGRVIQIECTEA